MLHISTRTFTSYQTNLGFDRYITAANNILQDPIVFASCFPSKPLDYAMNNIRNIGLNDETLEKILYKNSVKLLGLED